MRKAKIISCAAFVLGLMLISIGMTIQTNINEKITYTKKVNEKSTTNLNMAVAASNADAVFKKETINNNDELNSAEEKDTPNDLLKEISLETAPASVIIPPRVEVYDGLTLAELSDKINRNLGNDYVAGKGYLIASECLSRGVDPYIAVAILLHETGCKSKCSALTRTCNNVGGQKGAPGCNGGSYKAFATLDEGIVGFISNLQINYFSKGLTTIETIAPRYAQSSAWPAKINWYVEQIRAN